MDTKSWGSSLWRSLFCIAMNYPEKINSASMKHKRIRREYERFFDSLMYVLPCSYCRDSTLNILRKVVPLDFSGRESLMLTLYLWKCMVNVKLDAQKGIKNRKHVSFKTVFNKYAKHCTH